MRDFIEQLTEAYRLRDRGRIARLVEYVEDDCVIIGTSLGEWARGKSGFTELLESDFKYWVDIEIAQEYARETIGDYKLYTLSANAHYRFTVNEACYARYVGYMRDIRDEAIPEYAKAVKVLWELDHLIASKPGVRHRDAKPITIELLARAGKLQVVSFAHKRAKNHIDCFAGIQEDMDADFAEDLAFLHADKALTANIMNTVRLDGLRLQDAAVEKHGDWFVGCGTLFNDSSLDDEIKRDFDALDETQSPYKTLYSLRKRLGETLRLYSYGDKQAIMTRFYGVLKNGEIAAIRHTYPFYWILED